MYRGTTFHVINLFLLPAGGFLQIVFTLPNALLKIFKKAFFCVLFHICVF